MSEVERDEEGWLWLFFFDVFKVYEGIKYENGVLFVVDNGVNRVVMNGLIDSVVVRVFINGVVVRVSNGVVFGNGSVVMNGSVNGNGLINGVVNGSSCLFINGVVCVVVDVI